MQCAVVSAFPRLIALSLAAALAGCTIIANRGFAQEYESQELGVAFKEP